jgi:hypothetical protein
MCRFLPLKQVGLTLAPGHFKPCRSCVQPKGSNLVLVGLQRRASWQKAKGRRDLGASAVTAALQLASRRKWSCRKQHCM